MARQRDVWLIAAASGLVFAIYVSTFWPGILSPDSLHQYLQAATGRYDDWHPPLMAFLWSFLLFADPPTGAMMLAEAALLAAGLGLVALGFWRHGLRAAWLVPVVGLLPPIWIYAGVLWKDVLLAGFWACCLGAILNARAVAVFTQSGLNARYIGWTALAFVFAVVGSLTRHNAPLAAVPLFFAVFLRMRWLPRLSLVAAGLVLSVALNSALSSALAVRDTKVSASLFAFDLGGITHFTGVSQFPEIFTAEQERKLRNSCYNPAGVNNYLWGECAFVGKQLRGEGLWGSAAFRRTWIEAIVMHPLAYIRHRTNHFWALLRSVWGHRISETLANEFGFVFIPGLGFKVLSASVAIGEALGLFSPVMWFLIGSLLFFFTGMLCPWPALGAVRAALASGLLYELTYLPFGVAADFRYSYWMILAVALAAVFLGLAAGSRLLHRDMPASGNRQNETRRLSNRRRVTSLGAFHLSVFHSYQ